MAVAEPVVFRPRARFGELRQNVSHTSLFDRLALGGFALVTLVVLAAPLLAPHNPLAPVGPAFSPPGSGGFLLGTDSVGRDVLSRILYGARTTWIAGLAVIASGVVVGSAIGLVAGARGGWVDTVLMRMTDLFLALPAPILAIAVAAALGPGLVHTVLAVAVVWWPFYARIVRGEVKALAERPHLEAARLSGTSGWRRALRHLLPGALPAVIVTASLDVSNVILTFAALSFLGLGPPEPAPELGAMAARNLPYVLQEWWIATFASLAILLLALVGNLAGDATRDLLKDR